MTTGSDVFDRLFSRTTILNSPCWTWQGARTTSGYGSISIGGKSYLIHRWSYDMMRGDIPEGMTVDHRCTNKLCWNPDHLALETRADNSRRHYAKITRCPQGHKYTPENTRINSRGTRSCKACRKGQKNGRRVGN